MNPKVSPMRLAGLLVAFVLVVGAWTTAQARIHSLSGNARYQIGNGLPLPFGFTPAAPDGRILATGNATIRQHGSHVPDPDGPATGPPITTTPNPTTAPSVTNMLPPTDNPLTGSPAKVVIDPTQLTYPGTPGNAPIGAANTVVAQVQTAIPFQFPKSKVSFVKSGRTGAGVVTFCANDTVTANGNPGCPAGTTPPTTAPLQVPGKMIYVRTSHQFGGPAHASTLGLTPGGNPANANIAFNLGMVAVPCTAGPNGTNNPLCTIRFALATPQTMVAAGGVFGYTNMTVGAAPSPGNFYVTMGPNSTVLNVDTANPLGPGIANPATSVAGPWTTGRLSVIQPGPGETFVLSGSDGRAAGTGAGSLSLVAGSISQRGFSGPNANRGWLNLTVGSEVGHVPMMPLSAVGAVVGLLALSGGYVLRKRNRS